jgi:hypothetical protein
MPKKKSLRTPDEIRAESEGTRLKAWKEYQELRNTMPDDQALQEALRRGTPLKDDPYYQRFSPTKKRELDAWNKHGLWPPPELEADDRRDTLLTPSHTVNIQDSREEARRRIEKAQAEKRQPLCGDGHSDTLLSDKEILRKVKAMLNSIEIAERPTTAPGRESTLKTLPIAARFPKALVEELEALPGRKSHHLEKALTLYLRAIKSEE